MEMGYRDHIVAKLSALAVAGGTTAMLFTATPVHTQFSATTSGSLQATGAKVAMNLGNGNLVANNLLPGQYTTPTVVDLYNSGSVNVDYYLKIDNVTGIGTASGDLPNWTALQQLEYVYHAYSCSSYTSMPYALDEESNCTSVGQGTGHLFPSSVFPQTTPTLTDPMPTFPILEKLTSYAVVPSTNLEADIALKLGGYGAIYYQKTGWTLPPTIPGGANAWNGASVTISYSIVAEPVPANLSRLNAEAPYTTSSTQ
jgi:hypothetical protein